MSIVLSVLQVIGWILLFIFALLVLVVLVVLFWPAKYMIEGEWLDEKWVKINAHWFLHLIQFKLSYSNDLLYGEGGILWKKFTFSKDFTKVEDGIEGNASKDTDAKEKESMISKIKGMIERIKNLYPKFKKMVTDEKNKEAVVHLKDEIVYFLKVLLPKKSKLDAVFSTGSPDTTGQIFGITAMFPITYSKGWRVAPDFESDESYFRGSFWGKGKIYGYQLVGIVLRILFDKKCRRLYNILNQFIKMVKNDTNQEVKVNG